MDGIEIQTFKDNQNFRISMIIFKEGNNKAEIDIKAGSSSIKEDKAEINSSSNNNNSSHLKNYITMNSYNK